MTAASVAVVGGGISGLVAGYRLRARLGADARIVVFERDERVGGSLRTVEFAGGPVDVGAEAFVGRRPEVPALLAELGLSEQLVRPSPLRPLIRARGRTHAMPPGTLMGIPTAPDALRGLVDDATLDRIAVEPDRPLSWRDGDDVSVAELVGDRFGAQTVARSVDPLLGGVYAGLSGSIGVRSALPALAAALDAGAPNLRAAVTAALPPPSTAPVFGGLRDGYRVLLDALRAHVTVRPGAPVTALHRADDGWLIEPFGDRVDAVVVATPAPVAAALLAESAPGLAGLLRRVETASSALVALAVADDTPLPQHSGVLIATDEPLRAKAFTLSSRKWPHLADRPALLARASFGRFGDDRPLRWSDDELVAAAVEDLAAVIDAPVRPLDAVVQRWPDALPQYGPHHTRLVAAIDTALAPFPTLALAGNYLRGVGVPACLAAATAAAAHVAAGRRR